MIHYGRHLAAWSSDNRINDGNLFLVCQSFHHGYYCGYWMVPDASCWNVKALFPDERHLDECH